MNHATSLRIWLTDEKPDESADVKQKRKLLEADA